LKTNQKYVKCTWCGRTIDVTNQDIELCNQCAKYPSKSAMLFEQTKESSIETALDKKQREMAKKEKEVDEYREDQKIINYMQQADALAEVYISIFQQDPEDVFWNGDECEEKYYEEYAMTLAISQLAEIHEIDAGELAEKFTDVADKYMDIWREPHGFSHPWFRSGSLLG